MSFVSFASSKLFLPEQRQMPHLKRASFTVQFTFLLCSSINHFYHPRLSVCPHEGRGYSPSSLHPGVPHPFFTWGVSHQTFTGGGRPHPQQLDWGTPPCCTGWGTPLPEMAQHSEYLLSGGRYASHVHAGGLSC